MKFSMFCKAYVHYHNICEKKYGHTIYHEGASVEYPYPDICVCVEAYGKNHISYPESLDDAGIKFTSAAMVAYEHPSLKTGYEFL